MDRTKIPLLKEGKRHPDWALLYQSAQEVSLPWHYSKMDPDIAEEILRVNPKDLSLLDIGTGFGNQAKLLSELGFKVTAMDISEAAIKYAKEKYSGVNYQVADVTQSQLGTEFDLIIDRGCFHVLETSQRVRYIDFVSAHLKESGLVILKVFSQEQGNSDFGPLRYSLEELHRLFSPKFHITKVKRAEFQGELTSFPRAWCLVMKKNKGSHS